MRPTSGRSRPNPTACTARRLLQDGRRALLVVNPPFPTMTERSRSTRAGTCPYTRLPHPRYRRRGPIPAYEMIKHSINLHRGCFGGCSFCTISAHQGKFVVSRSQREHPARGGGDEAMPDFRGTITDLGGPSANMYRMKGTGAADLRRVRAPELHLARGVPQPRHRSRAAARNLPGGAAVTEGVKHAFVTSGLRYDLLLDGRAPPEVRKGATSATSMNSSRIMSRAGSRSRRSTPRTRCCGSCASRHSHSSGASRRSSTPPRPRCGKPQLQIVPYFISSHPGSRPEDMADLALQTKDLGFRLEQVQDFTPTPMTVATEIYATGLHPLGKAGLCGAHSRGEAGAAKLLLLVQAGDAWAAARDA